MTKELKIQFDFAHGPLWKEVYNPNTRTWSTGIKVIDNDEAINLLNDEAEKEYSSLYTFDSFGIPHFDATSYENKKTGLFSLVSAIIARATFLNDGSYIVKNLTRFEEK